MRESYTLNPEGAVGRRDFIAAFSLTSAALITGCVGGDSNGDGQGSNSRTITQNDERQIPTGSYHSRKITLEKEADVVLEIETSDPVDLLIFKPPQFEEYKNEKEAETVFKREKFEESLRTTATLTSGEYVVVVDATDLYSSFESKAGLRSDEVVHLTISITAKF
ncbi:MAG: hypothetical protein SV377_08380 [Halobacteria archaeon]|nr:hypothetical protein [Halobacteria archaeon]